MPELPDLEIYKKNLMKIVPNRVISAASVDYPAKVNVPGTVFAEKLVGAAVDRITREGKELCYHLNNGNRFFVHLMLSGRTVVGAADEIKNQKYKIASLVFEDQNALAFVDEARWCKVALNPPASKVPDALGENFTLDYFMRLTESRKRMNIKGLLLDQKCVRGIGNAYSDEILYAAKISPLSVVGKIPAKDLVALYEAIPVVLQDAIAQLERLAPDSISGEERSFLRVHNREKKHTDDGEPIIYAKVESKGTYYVKSQKFYM